MRLIQARSVQDVLWAATTFAEERSFAIGVAHGLMSVVLSPLDLVRMFVLAELYEAVDGPWRRTLTAARALPGPLGMVAYKTLFGDEFGPMRSLLREYYEERERFVAQIGKIIEHPLRFIEDLPEAVWTAMKEKWQRYVTLRGRHDLESQYEAGKALGELVGEVLTALMVVRQVGRLAKELPDVWKYTEKLKSGKPGKKGADGSKAAGAGTSGGGNSTSSLTDKPAARSSAAPSESAPRPNPAPEGETGPAPNPAPAGKPPAAEDSGPQVSRDQMTCTGDPVDVASGMVIAHKVDLELPGLLGFRWERVWYSTSTYAGPLGRGWHHSYDEALHVEGDGVRYQTSDGRNIKLPVLRSGEEHFDRKQRLTLRRDSAGYSVLTHEQEVHRFAPAASSPVHRLVAIEHPAGHHLSLRRDDAGNLRTVVDGAGQSVSFGYDASERITSILLPDPVRPDERQIAVRYGYDPRGNLTTVTDALGHRASYRYAEHQLVQWTDRAGLSFNFEYDGKGPSARCMRTWGDDGLYDHKLNYDVARGITVVEDSLGEKTLYEHRGGLVVRTVDPVGATTLTEYDEFNQKRMETDALGRQTRFFYDARGNLERVIRPDGVQVKAAYDANNRLRSVQEGTGAAWTFEHDAQGRLIERTNLLGGKTRYIYQGALLTEIIDAMGQRYRMQHDAQGNLTALHAPDSSVRRWAYDPLGRLRSATDPRGNVQRWTRDALGRATVIREPDGNLRELSYDAEGRVLRVKDKHRDVQFTYAGMGRIASRREAGTTVYFEYDTEERLRAVHNDDGHAYKFERAPNGWVDAEYGFDRVRRGYKRDLLGRIIEIQRANGCSSRFADDAMGRVSEVKHSDGGVDRYTYADDGGLLRADNGSCKLQFQRDAMGRVVRAQQDEHWIQSDYDARGQRVRIRSSLGLDQRIVRDALGRVQTLDAGAFQAQFARDLFGLELERTLPGGVRSRWQRDNLGRPLRHEIFAQDQTLRASTYSWDADARLVQLVDSEHGLVRYGYDARARLSWARYTDGTAELRMPDAVSNLFRTEDRNDRVYGPSGELLESIDRRGRVTKYRYDPDGNLLEKLEPGEQRWQFQWNAAGQLVRVVRPDGTKVDFRYDALALLLPNRFEPRQIEKLDHFDRLAVS